MRGDLIILDVLSSRRQFMTMHHPSATPKTTSLVRGSALDDHTDDDTVHVDEGPLVHINELRSKVLALKHVVEHARLRLDGAWS